MPQPANTLHFTYGEALHLAEDLSSLRKQLSNQPQLVSVSSKHSLRHAASTPCQNQVPRGEVTVPAPFSSMGRPPHRRLQINRVSTPLNADGDQEVLVGSRASLPNTHFSTEIWRIEREDGGFPEERAVRGGRPGYGTEWPSSRRCASRSRRRGSKRWYSPDSSNSTPSGMPWRSFSTSVAASPTTDITSR